MPALSESGAKSDSVESRDIKRVCPVSNPIRRSVVLFRPRVTSRCDIHPSGWPHRLVDGVPFPVSVCIVCWCRFVSRKRRNGSCPNIDLRFIIILICIYIDGVDTPRGDTLPLATLAPWRHSSPLTPTPKALYKLVHTKRITLSEVYKIKRKTKKKFGEEILHRRKKVQKGIKLSAVAVA